MSASIERINNCGNCAYMDLMVGPQQQKQMVCRYQPPVGHPVVAIVPGAVPPGASEPLLEPRFLGTITVWPEVAPNLWCGRHSISRIEQVRDIPKQMQTFGGMR